jgi:hypothetical protein
MRLRASSVRPLHLGRFADEKKVAWEYNGARGRARGVEILNDNSFDDNEEDDDDDDNDGGPAATNAAAAPAASAVAAAAAADDEDGEGVEEDAEEENTQDGKVAGDVRWWGRRGVHPRSM